MRLQALLSDIHALGELTPCALLMLGRLVSDACNGSARLRIRPGWVKDPVNRAGLAGSDWSISVGSIRFSPISSNARFHSSFLVLLKGRAGLNAGVTVWSLNGFVLISQQENSWRQRISEKLDSQSWHRVDSIICEKIATGQPDSLIQFRTMTSATSYLGWVNPSSNGYYITF